MAAILFLVTLLGFVLAGREQAHAADGSEPLLRFQLWQLALGLVLPLVFVAEVPAIAKVIAVAATAAALSLSVRKARHAHDADDLHF
jgi:hypothetical protein